MDDYIPLNRQFSPVPHSQGDAENDEALSFWDHVSPKTWDDMNKEYRCVILAEAGAGKTEELRHQAKVLSECGKLSFFIRIEDIEGDFYKAFEIGTEIRFDSWLQSAEEAWFFLDSVDEARLENPRAFKKALRLFSKAINRSAHRAHIYLSGRPYAWRPKEDRSFLDEILFLAAPQQNEDGDTVSHSKVESALTLYTLRPLNEERVRRFCEVRDAENIDRLIHEIERSSLWGLAERPFDLEGILAKWAEDSALGSRLELLRHNIDRRLRDDHNTDRAQRQPLNLERGRQGIRRLAAAVLLTGEPGIMVPDATPDKPGIEAEKILDDWDDPQDVRVLLERGVFNDLIFGAVRFRHRDVRELLAAEWFHELLKTGNSRHLVESLFFREQYGEKIVTPRLRPILPWLILFDDEICRRSLSIHPEIAVEGGDPSRLPLRARRKILTDIVRRIVANEDDRSARDNSAIARIANTDLTEDVQRLILEFIENDDAIFFLGRLVWQGEMASCVAPFIAIGADGARGIYARRASVRAVMNCGSVDQVQSLWQKLNGNNTEIPRELLTELIGEAAPDDGGVKHLIISLGKLPAYDRYKASGLGDALGRYIARLQIERNSQTIVRLLDGLHGYLNTAPYVERRECHVSKEYAWLLSHAVNAVERLVEVKSPEVLTSAPISILLMVPALRFWRETDFREHKSNLRELVPGWLELNDALYWASVEQARSARETNSNAPLIDDWSISWLGHFWAFDVESLPRLFGYMHSRSFPDDRLVALSTAFRVYEQADKPTRILTDLKEAVIDDPVLQNRLNDLLNPSVTEEMLKNREEEAEWQREQEKEQQREEKARDTWITDLRANPDRVRKPPNLGPDEITNDRYWLMQELSNHHVATDRSEYADWKGLIPEFGEAVAHAYRDGALSQWQKYVPTVRSEEDYDNSIPYALIFAMAGIEIEAIENPDFPSYLDGHQVRHALRYLTRELNGFPCWVERTYLSFPLLVRDFVLREMIWELENSDSETPMHYIVSDIVYHAPWLHAAIAPAFLEWVGSNEIHNIHNLHHCIYILIKGGIEAIKLSLLAEQQIGMTNDPDRIPIWYALRVDCDPEQGIPGLEKWLARLNLNSATRAAQIFITSLFDDDRFGRPQIGGFRTAMHLKSLYVLMHKYIPAKDDIDRVGGGVYSPELRDDAKDARNQLFKLLSEIPGSSGYSAIKQLICDHPDPDYRQWMGKHAYKKAEEDGDLELWSVEQVSNFHKSQTLIPETHRQLYELTVGRLNDLKNWVERGNDSPYRIWQRVENETEMRNSIAGWLNQQRHDRYITAQEPELANSQRMDIWLQNTNVQSPIPIELKLLDKGWTGPNLCERLRNQLAGDYLREESAGCGVMLLVWKGINPQRRWIINGRRVSLDELAVALKSYWQDIADQFPNVKAIEVITIDLGVRAEISDL